MQTFADALRGAVRQDPDVVFIGEMRDRETLVAALQAAETGHLVFCTLHTADTMQSLSRMLEFFPPDQHAFIRSSLANGLKAILAQRLLPAIDPKISRVPACEVLLGEGIVKEKIREGADTDLPEIILGSKHSGHAELHAVAGGFGRAGARVHRRGDGVRPEPRVAEGHDAGHQDLGPDARTPRQAFGGELRARRAGGRRIRVSWRYGVRRSLGSCDTLVGELPSPHVGRVFCSDRAAGGAVRLLDFWPAGCTGC